MTNSVRRSAGIIATTSTVVALLSAVSMGLAGPASAAPGGSDSSFGSGGLATSAGGSGATGVAVVPAGVTGAGNIVTSGTSDSSDFQLTDFSPTGSVLWQRNLYSGGEAFGVAVVPAGKTNAGDIVVAGYVSPSGCAVVAEYTPSGSLNANFGTSGAAQLCLADAAQFSGVAVDSAGRIVAAGQEDTVAATTPETLVARFTTAGKPDTSFNTTGYLVQTLPGTSTSSANAVAVVTGSGLADKDVVFTAGTSVNGASAPAFTVAAFNGSGLYDAFNTTGFKVGSAGVGKGIVALPDGSVAAAGFTGSSTTSNNFLLTHYGANGSVLWSNSGPSTGVADEWDAVTYQPNGNFLVAAGTAPDTGISESMVAAQFNATSGTLNNAFGSSGLAKRSFAGGFNAASAGVAVQSDGKTVVAGSVPRVNAVTQIGLVRLAGPTMSVSNPGTVTVYQDGPVTVNFPVHIDEALTTSLTATMCAPGAVVNHAGSCASVTFPANHTGINVPVTVQVTNTAGHSQFQTLQLRGGPGFAVSPTAGTGQIKIQHLPPPPGFNGYWFVASDGGVFNFGHVGFYGSAGGLPLAKPIVGMAATNDGGGYWLVASDGGIFSYGNAHFYGSTGGIPLAKPIVGMASTPDGRGYWLVASDGGIFSYGDARFFGSTGGIPLNKPIVGMASTPDGRGYYLVASDGGIFSYGDARFFGSTGGIPLAKPIVGMAENTTGAGYWLVASDGGIFSYGDAHFHGSTGGIPLNKPIVGMAATYGGGGYWLVASDGGIFSYGNAKFYGSTGGVNLVKPIVGMAG